MMSTPWFILPMWIGLLGGTLMAARRTKRWKGQAHKMAETADLALPARLEPLVMRYLRNRSTAVLPATMAVAATIFLLEPSGPKAHLRAGALLLALAVVPALLVVSGVLPSFVVRWRAQGSPRLAHLERLTLRDVTTTRERRVLVVAVGAACVTAALGFHFLSRGSGWAWVPPIVVLAAAACSCWYVKTILSGRSTGSDTLELAWDDVLRIRKVREALMTVALLLPLELFLVGMLHAFQPLPPGVNGSTPFMAEGLCGLALLVGAGIYAGSMQENEAAYRSWRRLWPHVPPTSSAGAAG
jgi:hypothetical protein